MVTIEVSRKEKGDEFTICDMEMFHQDCDGGKIHAEPTSASQQVKLSCVRCGFYCFIESWLQIVKTAVDGEERKFTCLVDEKYHDRAPHEAVVVQRK